MATQASDKHQTENEQSRAREAGVGTQTGVHPASSRPLHASVPSCVSTNSPQHQWATDRASVTPPGPSPITRSAEQESPKGKKLRA